MDIGQTGVKAEVFDTSGKSLTRSYREYGLLFPKPGFCELDPQSVMDAAFRVIRESAGRVRKTNPVQAIGIASQGEAFTPVAADGAFLGQAMITSDSRAEALVPVFSRTFGREKLYLLTGHTPYHMYSLYKLLWLKKNQPDVWRNTNKFLFFEDLLGFVLTGASATDYTLASRSMLFDVRRKKWSGEILSELQLAEKKLPEALPAGTSIGTIKPDVSRRLELGKNTQVVLAGHDQPCGGLGSGAAVPGSASYSMGTSECICPALDRLLLGPELMASNLATYPHVVPETYTTVAFNITGGSTLKWLRDNLAIEETVAARKAGRDPYEQIISAAADEPTGLIVIPHFGPTGTPHFDPAGTGVIFGLKLTTRRAEVWRAFLEGITYEMKWNLSILEKAGFRLKELRGVGGGAKSAVWMQIKADILGIPLTTTQVTEAACMGAGLQAGGALGLLDAGKASGQWAKPVRTFRPRPQYADFYEKNFRLYQEIYCSLKKARGMLNEK